MLTPPPTHSITPAISPMSDAEILEKINQKEMTPSNPNHFWGMLLLFIGLGAVFWDWKYTLMILFAIFFHECGHYLAFKIFGCKNVKMMFVPMLGGFVSAEAEHLTPSKHVLVSLAGPVMGFLFVCLTVASMIIIELIFGKIPYMFYFFNFMIVSSIINLLNLLPILPLDGGQVINVLIFARNWRIEAVFKALSIVALIALALYFKTYFILIIPILLLLNLGNSIKLLKVKDLLKKKISLSDKITEDDILIIRSELKNNGLNLYEKYPQNLPDNIRNIWFSTKLKSPGIFKSVALLFTYLIIILLGLFLMGFSFGTKDAFFKPQQQKQEQNISPESPIIN